MLLEAAALAVKEEPISNAATPTRHCPKRLNAVYLPKKDLDVSVGRLMTARMKLGMFDPE